MKKISVLLVAIMLCFALISCAAPVPTDADIPASESPSVAPSEEPAPSEEAPAVDPAVLAEFIGSWWCGRANIVISQNEDMTLAIEINWADSAFENNQWVLTGTYDTVDEQVLYTNGKCSKFVYDEEKDDMVETVVYEDGTGCFKLEGNKLYWTDDKENQGADCAFEKETNTEAYLGSWQCGRANIEIAQNEDATLAIEINWADSAAVNYKWLFTGTYDESLDRITYTNGTCIKEVAESAENITETTLYEDGSGFFYLENDNLIWKDEKEDQGADCLFEKLAFYSSASDFIGSWCYERANIDISQNEDDTFAVKVSWANSAEENREWMMTAIYDEDLHALVYTNGHCGDFIYDAKKDDMVETVRYEDGTGSFTLEEGKLFWQDEKEDQGQDLAFESAE